MIDWKQKLKNQWVQIEISRLQPGKPVSFLRLVSFLFKCSSEPFIDVWDSLDENKNESWHKTDCCNVLSDFG